ncbi:Ankrd7 [Symbiodinium necroappetens]|uniref:Ankrd7 protein n=1 Tax=Symbiodinium necroappetens TaxID=1628268 RepID=A0A812W3S8_9DINO|nr:Ankrd7 [Symbiodinium necroappetens]
MEKRPASSWGFRRCALLVAAGGGGWTSRALLSDPSSTLGQRLRGRWAGSDRSSNLQRAHRDGVFQVRDRFDAGAELGEEEMSWTREYGEGGSFPFWSLGQPKVEIRRLAAALEEASGNGLAAVVLGCGLGLDVAYLAKAGKASALTAVAGVDFAWPAIQEARRQHGDSGQAGRAACFFHHFDVCELPAPTVPLDLIIDNTVFQNVHRSGRFDAYLESLCRISTPGLPLSCVTACVGLSAIPSLQRERCIRKCFLGRGWSGFLILIAAGFVGKFNLGWVRVVWFS